MYSVICVYVVCIITPGMEIHEYMKVETFKGICKYLLWPLTTVGVSSSRL